MIALYRAFGAEPLFMISVHPLLADVYSPYWCVGGIVLPCSVGVRD